MAHNWSASFSKTLGASLTFIAGGTDYPPSIAGTDNAQTFFKTGVCAALNWGLNIFYFEAFDEPAKPAATGTNGGTVDETHWGAFTAYRKSKFSLSC